MGRDTCRFPTCDEPTCDSDDAFTSQFCGTYHELKYEHLQDDAREAEWAEQERHSGERRRDLPEYDGPPY